jgi:hypothetical protein
MSKAQRARYQQSAMQYSEKRDTIPWITVYLQSRRKQTDRAQSREPFGETVLYSLEKFTALIGPATGSSVPCCFKVLDCNSVVMHSHNIGAFCIRRVLLLVPITTMSRAGVVVVVPFHPTVRYDQRHTYITYHTRNSI